MSFYETRLVPDFENEAIEKIVPITQFVSTKLMNNYISFLTAVDDREREEKLAAMILCNSSLLLLSLAYIAEKEVLVENAKEIMRKV